MEDNYNPNSPFGIQEFAKAFIIAKRSFKGTGKESKGHNYTYANLDSVYGAVEEALNKNEIFIYHYAQYLGNNETVLNTRLMHAPSGQYIEDTRLLESEKPGNQAKGSANTYMRRYAVLSLCALSTADDDCADEETHINEKKSPIKKTEVEDPNKKIYPQQVDELKQLLRKLPDQTMVDVVQDIYERYDIDILDDIPFTKWWEVKKAAEKGKLK